MTKALGEKLMVRANDLSSTTQFVCIRGGNVLGTNGSVVPFFRNRILQGEDLPLTHKDMTRFFLTLPEAIELLLSAAKAAVGGETFVMKMNACLILDLAEVLMEQLSDQPLSVKDVGIRPGRSCMKCLFPHMKFLLPTNTIRNTLSSFLRMRRLHSMSITVICPGQPSPNMPPMIRL